MPGTNRALPRPWRPIKQLAPLLRLFVRRACSGGVLRDRVHPCAQSDISLQAPLRRPTVFWTSNAPPICDGARSSGQSPRHFCEPADYKVRSSAAPSAGAVKVIGYDAAGVVVETGPQASLFRAGDEVFYAGSVIRSGTNAEFHLATSASSGVCRARSDLPRPRPCRSRRSPRGKPRLIAWTSVSR